jgi:repressor LexA
VFNVIRIKQLREKSGHQQKSLALDLGVSQPTVCDWESGKKIPSFRSTIKIADYFGVSTDYLLGKSNNPNPSNTLNAIRIPVLGRIPAGVPVEAIEDVIDYEEVPLDWSNGGKEYFALQLKGSSMSPKYLEKDIVIFLKSSVCETGNDCAVIINGEDATFKKVVKHTDGVVLQPINTEGYTPIFYSNAEIERLPLRVIGIAKEIRRKI